MSLSTAVPVTLPDMAARAAPVSAAHSVRQCSMPAMVASSSAAASWAAFSTAPGSAGAAMDAAVGPAVEVVSDIGAALARRCRTFAVKDGHDRGSGMRVRSIALGLLGQQPVGGGGDEGLDPRFGGPGVVGLDGGRHVPEDHGGASAVAGVGAGQQREGAEIC